MSRSHPLRQETLIRWPSSSRGRLRTADDRDGGVADGDTVIDGVGREDVAGARFELSSPFRIARWRMGAREHEADEGFAVQSLLVRPVELCNVPTSEEGRDVLAILVREQRSALLATELGKERIQCDVQRIG